MALSKEAKSQVVEELTKLLAGSKLTVIAKYSGTPVKAMQQLRRQAKDSGTVVKVFKNRLVVQALKSSADFKEIDTEVLNGMLMYAFNDRDEVASAQSLYNFAKTNPNIEFVGAISPEGQFLNAEMVKSLAVLPSKNQLLSGVILLLGSPLSGSLAALKGQLPSLIKGLEVKAS